MDEENNKKQKLPEFIVIEEDPEFQKQHYKKEEDQFFSSFYTLKNTGTFPGIIRIAFVFGAVLLSIGVILTFFLFAFAAVLNALTFFQLEDVNKRVKTTWNLWKKLVAFLLGAVVGVFSPQFGIGIITTYLLLHNDTSVFFNKFTTGLGSRGRPW